MAYAQEEAETGCLIGNNESSFSENNHPEDRMMAPSDSSSGDENRDTCNEHNESDGIQKSVERTEEVNSYTIDISTVASRNLKRKIVDESCGEIIAKKRGLITSKVTNPMEPGPSSLEHMEVQKDLNKEALRMSLGDEAAICLKAPITCLEDWDATKSITHMSEIKQSVEEIVHQYVEKVATVFDSSTLPPAPKKLDRIPGAPLQLSESACPSAKYAFQKIIADLKNLQTRANAEPFNQRSFVEEVTMMLDGWEIFFSSHFTEETKQMVAKLKFLKKELDDESSQPPQRTTEELTERTKQVGEMLEEAVVVRKQISQSVTEIEQMKLAGDKSQVSINTQKDAHTSNIHELEKKIQELEKKLAEEKGSLRLVESFEAKNGDFFEEEMVVSEAISVSFTSFNKLTAEGNALSKEISKRCQQIEENGGLPAPLHALRSLIVRYPIEE